MTAPPRIQLRHPEGKRAPSIERDRYERVRTLMLGSLPRSGQGITWVDLRTVMDKKLGASLEGGNNWWYTHAVKLHLEATGEIARVGASPQRLRRVQARRSM